MSDLVMHTCCYCNKPGDLRPYGPKGQMICYPCMKAYPEREQEAERNLARQLKASGPIVVLDGTEVGPYPAKHHPDLDTYLGKRR